MRIKLEVSGGVGGLQQTTKEVDSSQVPEAEAAHWRELIERADYFALPRENVSRNGRDLMQYTITVEDESKLHQVTVDDLTIGQPLIDLVANLRLA